MKASVRWLLTELAVVGVAGGVGWLAGCGAAQGEQTYDSDAGSGAVDAGTAGLDARSPGVDGPRSTTSPVPQCTECLTSDTCGGEVCAQIQGDSFCAPSCETAACPTGTACAIESAYNGDQVSVCVPTTTCVGGATSSSSDTGEPAGGQDAGSSSRAPICVPASSNCDGYADPDTPSTCDGCSKGSKSCQSNGCYGGWYCDLATRKCHAPPDGCSAGGSTTCTSSSSSSEGSTKPGSGSGSSSSSGTSPTTVTGTVTASGGSVSSLLFAIAGDTRPANEDDTAGYPTTIIDTIFSDITARNPQPSFVVSTGDYQFANPTGSESAPQIADYMAARAKYPGTLFPAMGNHECTGYTASNCGSGNSDGVTSNYSNFLSVMLGPLSQPKPYYSINVQATDSSWTSKFVFIAANAWDSAQSTWLETTLSQSTTYTFVIRHEANEANTAPGTTPSESIVTQHPLTLEICGHTHDYSKSGNRIVMGNGGAPLTGGGDYGYGVVAQLSNGNLTVDEYDYQTNAADSSFHFVVSPTGVVQ